MKINRIKDSTIKDYSIYIIMILFLIIISIFVIAVAPTITNMMNYTNDKLTYIFSVNSSEYVNGTCQLYGNWSNGHSDSNFGKLSNPTDGLIRYWNFDSAGYNVSESVNNNYLVYKVNGTQQNSTNFTVEGKVSNAFNLSGDRYYNTTFSRQDGTSIAINAISENNPPLNYTQNFSMGGWFKTTMFIRSGNSMSLLGYQFKTAISFQGVDEILFGTRSGADTDSIGYDTNAGFNDGQWHHVIGTYETNSSTTGILKLYYDGVYRGSNGVYNFFNTTGTTFYIGHIVLESNTQSFEGLIDEVRIYNKTLSQSEVTTLYETTQIGEMVSYYQLEGNALDSKGSNNGNITGTINATGKVKEGIKFDGVDDYINYGDKDLFSPYSNNNTITFSLWTKINEAYTGSGSNARQTLFGKRSLNNIEYEFVKTNNSANFVYFCEFNSKGTSSSTITLVTEYLFDEWIHLVVSLNGTHMLGYYNGQFIDDSLIYNLNISGTANFVVGGTSYYFNGTIDEVMIFNRSLTSNEIKKLYEVQGIGKWQYNESLNMTNTNFTSKTFTENLNLVWGVNCTDLVGTQTLSSNISFSTKDTLSSTIFNQINYTNDRLNYTFSGISTETGVCTLYGNWSGIWTKIETKSVTQDLSFNFTSINFTSEGYNYLWNINCSDTSNNDGIGTNISFTTADTTTPTMNSTVSTTFYTLTFTLNSSESVNVSVKGALTNEVTSFYGSYSYTFTGLEDGNLYVYDVIISDSSGNSRTYSFETRLPTDLAEDDHSSGSSGATIIYTETNTTNITNQTSNITESLTDKLGNLLTDGIGLLKSSATIDTTKKPVTVTDILVGSFVYISVILIIYYVFSGVGSNKKEN